jgi:hypothetical protein
VVVFASTPGAVVAEGGAVVAEGEAAVAEGGVEVVATAEQEELAHAHPEEVHNPSFD